MLGAHAGVVQPGGDAVRFSNLAVFVLKDVGFCPVEHADCSRHQRGGMFDSIKPPSRRLHADELDLLIIQEGVENADGVAAAADTGDDIVGETP